MRCLTHNQALYSLQLDDVVNTMIFNKYILYSQNSRETVENTAAITNDEEIVKPEDVPTEALNEYSETTTNVEDNI